MHHAPRVQRRIRTLLLRAKELRLSASAELRLQWLVFAAEHGGNVSLTCRHFGIARSTFLRWSKRFNPRDERSLEEKSRRPRRVRQSQVPEQAVALIAQWRQADPHMNRTVISRLLAQQGILLSPAGVGRVITRERLFFADTPSHAAKRAEAPLAHPLPTDHNTTFPRGTSPNLPLTPSLA